MSVTQSPPSASITATSRITRPGSCAERRSRVGVSATDSAPVNPARSANSTSNATPACETNPSPSAVTSTVPRRASGFTNWVSSWVACRDFSNPDPHGPGGRSPHPTSARYRRFEVRWRRGWRQLLVYRQSAFTVWFSALAVFAIADLVILGITII